MSELEAVKLELEEQRRLVVLYAERSRRLSEILIEHSRTAHGSRRTSDVPVTVTTEQGELCGKRSLDDYFGALQRKVRNAGEEEDFCFLMVLTDVEEQLFHDVVAIAGDREFPDDLRQLMLHVFATKALYQPYGLVMPRHTYVKALQGRYSLVVEEMHSLWRELARRQLKTRFGVLNDSPSYLAFLREDWDS